MLVLALLSAAVIGFVSCSGSSTFTKISVTPANTTVATGSITTPLKFTATETLDDNSMSLDMSSLVTWDLQGTAVIGIDFSGNATLSSTKGVSTITAIDKQNNLNSSVLKTSATLTIADPVSIAITPINAIVSLSTTSSQQFTAIASLDTAPTVTQNLSSLCTWTTTKSSVATIPPKSGVASLISTGTTTITANYTFNISSTLTSQVTGTTTLTVINQPSLTFITVTPFSTNPVSLSTGTVPFSAAWNNSSQDITPNVFWSTSNSLVASINDNGVADLKSAGTVTIYATEPITGVTGSAPLSIQ